MILLIFASLFALFLWRVHVRNGRQGYGPLHFPAEKEDIVAVEVRKDGQRRRNALPAFIFAVACWLAMVVVMGTVFDSWPFQNQDEWILTRPYENGDDPNYFDWSQVVPSAKLELVPCYASHQCARLEVPLDWNSTASAGGPKAAIAIIKKPAIVEVTDPRYGGAVLTNPGGPGGSGVGFHLYGADSMRQIIDTQSRANVSEDEEKYFDLISFDPRGVGNTFPKVIGLEDPMVRAQWLMERVAVGQSVADPAIFNKVWSRQKLYGQAIETLMLENKQEWQMGSFITTAFVVRDMVEIIEAHGRWREARAFNLLQGRFDDEAKAAWNRTRWTPGEEMLNYWGISYGTILGQTFASLQPHRVGRVVLDGVVDANDYSNGAWQKNLQDTDAITRVFAERCVTAGPERCAIAHWAGPQKDIAMLIALVQNTINNLKDNPLTYFDPESPAPFPGILTYDEAVVVLFIFYYSPGQTFRIIADLLKSLEAGDAKALLGFRQPLTCPPPALPMFDPEAPGVAIRCTDAGSQTNMTKSVFRKHIETLRSQTPFFWEYWSTLRMPCHGFEPPQPEDHDVWRFTGPFGAETANPILLASQRYDPVTPLRNAEYAADHLFPGAGVLNVVDGAGHSTLGWPSLCAVEAIRNYFATGDVGGSSKRIECKVSFDPFEDNEEMQTEAVLAAKNLGEKLNEEGWGLGHRLESDLGQRLLARSRVRSSLGEGIRYRGPDELRE
ncbi:MAG: hypothetical protein MMC23_004599 [Stictis urceolatum]|nr:hypothetical protein [Stictis urceolata]